jgi:uracil-DNA glycosylase
MSACTIVICGEAWGAREAEAGAPFVGPSGSLLNKMLIESELLSPASGANADRALWQRNYRLRDRIYEDAGIRLTNVFNFQPPQNRIEELCGSKVDGALAPIRPGKYLSAEYFPELARLREELAVWSPNLIVGLGATALWFMMGRGAITKQRGTIMTSQYGKFLPTFHPAYLMRGQWELRPIVVSDLAKAKREAATREVIRPARTIYVPETIADIEDAAKQIERSPLVAIDIETAIEQITCVGFAWSPTECLTIPFLSTSRPGNSYWSEADEREAVAWVRRLCALPMPKVFQNGLYDLHYLWRSYGITVENCLHDTMLLHHALHPEVKKSLGFLGSLYSDEPAWKQMRARGKNTLKREDE